MSDLREEQIINHFGKCRAVSTKVHHCCFALLLFLLRINVSLLSCTDALVYGRLGWSLSQLARIALASQSQRRHLLPGLPRAKRENRRAERLHWCVYLFLLFPYNTNNAMLIRACPFFYLCVQQRRFCSLPHSRGSNATWHFCAKRRRFDLVNGDCSLPCEQLAPISANCKAFTLILGYIFTSKLFYY